MTQHDQSTLAEFRSFATELAQIAIASAKTAKADLTIEIKEDGSPVTNVDKAVERAIRAHIQAVYPDHGILGEEFGSHNRDADLMWVIDPIDGTRQFAAGLPNYGILIALCSAGIPKIGVICHPDTKDIYLGLQGQGCWLNDAPIRVADLTAVDRCIVGLSDPDAFDAATLPGMERLRAASMWNVFDGGCMSFAALAAGRIGVSICGPNLDNFDICALVPVVEGAGGVITDWQGKPLTFASKGEIVASATPALHQQALALLNGTE